MKNETNNVTEELLVKCLAGEASGTEMQQVETWVHSNSDNQKHYNDLKLIWNKTKDVAALGNVNSTEAWERFKMRIQTNSIPITSNKQYNWLKIAALLLLFVGSGTILFFSRKNGLIAEKTSQILPQIVKTKASNNKSETINNEQFKENNTKKINEIKNEVEAAPPLSVTTRINEYKEPGKIAGYRKAISSTTRKTSAQEYTNKTKGIICNGTTCPIEICITQTIKCHGQPSTVSTCSTLEPDESGMLHYKTHDKIGKHCTMSVDEITIKTVSTGETIVLNAYSKPSTAQEFFNYIKKGGVIASAFQNDCSADCGLKFNNNFGDLILQ